MSLKNPYCTLADVQMECANSTPEAEPVLINAINLASRYIDAECGRDFLLHDHTGSPYMVRPDEIGGNYILLPFPCLNPSEVSIKIDGEAIDPSEFRVVNNQTNATSCVIRRTPWNPAPASAVRLGLARQTVPLVMIEISGRFGFTPNAENPEGAPSDEIPGTLRAACAQIAAVRSGKLKKESTGLDGSRISTAAKTIPREAIDVLKRMKIRTSF